MTGVTESNPADGQREAEQLLLVDDNPSNLQILIATLKDCGYKLLVAKDGESALAIARKAHPELILLDIMMPGIDGYEVCRQLKADPKTAKIAVIFLSALDETSDKVKGFATGAVDYIAKPFQPEEVLARVDTHLKIRRLEQDLSFRNRELEAANLHLRRDFEAATRVQRALLPSELPQVDHISIAWEYRPSDALAGDALNAYKINDRYLSFYVIDASGHGVSAALLSVMVTRSLMPQADRSSLVTEIDAATGDCSVVGPAEVARRLNTMYQMQDNGMLYFTLLYCILDIETNRVQYVSAGHPGPIRIGSAGEIAILDAPDVPVGILEQSEYQESEIQLYPGDRLYLHSDGLNEEHDSQGEELGRERLCQVIKNGYAQSLETSVEKLVQTGIDWRGDENFRDDVSILALEVKQRA